MISTSLTRLLGMRHPIVSAPMANWSGGELAREVSAAGGLGMIGVGSATPTDWVEEQARIAGRVPFGIGLMCWALEGRPELLDAALATGPAAVSLSFGDPTPYLDRVREAGAVSMAQVQDAAAARHAAEAGVDVLVAQGTDAGGHTGAVGTMPVLQRVLLTAEAAGGRPVLAAGGIGTGLGVAGVLAMGAAGAWIGTRFCATAEALGTEEAKRRILEADETSTVHTRVFDLVQGIPWPERFPGRALRNAFTERWHGREEMLSSQLSSVAEEFRGAQRRGDYSEDFVYAGQAAGLVEDLPPAGELVRRLAAEAEGRLRACRDLLDGPS